MTSSISKAMVASHRVCLRRSASQWLARTTSFTVQRTTTRYAPLFFSVRTLQTTTTTTTHPTTTTPIGTTDRKWFSSSRTPTTHHQNDPIITGTIPPRGHGVQVGQLAQVQRTFSLSDVQTYGRLVGDENPLHQPPSSWTNSELGLSQDDVEFFQTHPLLQQPEQEQQSMRNNDNDKPTRTTPKPLIVVHGMLVASLFSCIFGTLAPGAVYMKQSLQFHKPVYVTQPVVATTTITRIRDWTGGRRRGTQAQATNSRGGVVLTCDTTVQSLASNNNNNDDNNNKDTNPEDDATILYVSGEATVWLLQGYPATVDAVDSSSRDNDNDNDSHPKNDGSNPSTTSTSHTTTTTT